MQVSLNYYWKIYLVILLRFPILVYIYCLINILNQKKFLDATIAVIIDSVIINVVITIITEAQTTHESSNQLQREVYWTRCDADISKYWYTGKLIWFLHCNISGDINLGRAIHQISEWRQVV